MWTLAAAGPRAAGRVAKAAEDAGWTGMAVVDSQNLAGDPYVVLTVAALATSTLGLATGVTNPVTRHPAVTAGAAASVDSVSSGRMHLAIGRGDSALAHLGRAPATVRALDRYLNVLKRYLAAEEVPFDDLDFHERLAPPVDSLGLADTVDTSRVGWIRVDRHKVPLEVAATGPKVIATAARHADRVMLAVGADPERVAWGIAEARRVRPDIPVGVYVNMACHRDRDAARGIVQGGVASFARFSVMHGTVAGPASAEDASLLTDLHRSYDMRHHTRADAQQADVLTPAFIDRFAIVGPPEVCLSRLEQLASLGIDKVVVIGPTFGADRGVAGESAALVEREVLPALG